MGPATASPQKVRALVAAGMNVARLNFSHGSHEMMMSLVRIVRSEAEKRDRSIAGNDDGRVGAAKRQLRVVDLAPVHRRSRSRSSASAKAAKAASPASPSHSSCGLAP